MYLTLTLCQNKSFIDFKYSIHMCTLAGVDNKIRTLLSVIGAYLWCVLWWKDGGIKAVYYPEVFKQE